MTTYTILGAGLAGLSCSYHLGHQKCLIFERQEHPGGHVFSHRRGGFVWDEGPHVSFTKNEYVRGLFEKGVNGEFRDYAVQVSNYFHGSWIPHPAQSNLFAVPEPHRTACLEDFLRARKGVLQGISPKDYAEWIEQAFGKTFSETFPAAYTRKYWTVDAKKLTTDWVGNRVFVPDVENVRNGYLRAQPESTHYIKAVRYPKRGGYMAFAGAMLEGAQLQLGHEVVSIDLHERRIAFANGSCHDYEKLISTIPLPELIRLASAPPEILAAASELCCTSLLLVNVTADHVAKKPFHWMYVYDEDKLATRVSCINLLSPSNAPAGTTGIQVEVYESRYRPLRRAHEDVAKIVCRELIEMGLVDSVASVHTQYVPYANVLFDHKRRANQERVLVWLAQHGLHREADDLEPTTDWEGGSAMKPGALALAGRFGQWKYFWTDDCVLRGRAMASAF